MRVQNWRSSLFMNRKRMLLGVLGLCIVGACVAIFLLTARSTSESTRTLPDGSTLTVRGITKGTKHRYVSGDLIQRTADRVLPERWAKKLGATVLTHNSSNVTHILWMERVVAPSNSVRFSGIQTRGTVFQTILGPRVTNDAGFDRYYQPAAQLYT